MNCGICPLKVVLFNLSVETVAVTPETPESAVTSAWLKVPVKGLVESLDRLKTRESPDVFPAPPPKAKRIPPPKVGTLVLVTLMSVPIP